MSDGRRLCVILVAAPLFLSVLCRLAAAAWAPFLNTCRLYSRYAPTASSARAAAVPTTTPTIVPTSVDVELEVLDDVPDVADGVEPG